MKIVMWVLLFLNQLFLLWLYSVNIHEYYLSDFQLKTQFKDKKDEQSLLLVKINKNLQYLQRIQQFGIVVALIICTIILNQIFSSPVLGSIGTLMGTVIALALSRSAIIKKYSRIFFFKFAEQIVVVANWLSPLWFITGFPEVNHKNTPGSEDELKDFLSKTTLINKEERARLTNIISVNSKQASDIMTPSKKVVSIQSNAILGPILLSELEKSNHKYFPVLDKDQNVVGLLNLKSVEDVINSKEHKKILDIMEGSPAWVSEDMSFYRIVQICISAKQYVLLVQNEMQEFSGIITVTDLLQQTIITQ